jgi:Spy/CpxP family protein refolding chaperone
MQRSLSALMTAILAVPVVGYLTHGQLQSGSQSAAFPPLQIMLHSPNASDIEPGLLNRHPALQHLELTSEQAAQIKTLQAQAQPDLMALMAQLRDEQDTLERLIANDDTSAIDLRMQHQLLQALQQAIADNQFEVLLGMREVLTPEQRTLLSMPAELSAEERGQKPVTQIRLN